MTVWVVQNEFTDSFVGNSGMPTTSYYDARKYKTFDDAYSKAEEIDPDGDKGWDPREYKW